MFVGFSLKIDLTRWISNVLLFGKSIPAWQCHRHKMLKKKKKKSWQKLTFKIQLYSSRREGAGKEVGVETQDLPPRLNEVAEELRIVAAHGPWVGRTWR